MIIFLICLYIAIVLALRWFYLGIKIGGMQLQMAKYGSFLYVKLSSDAYRELVTQETMENFENYLEQLAAIDESSVRVTNAVQKDMLPIKS
jgi:hypothetical protein